MNLVPFLWDTNENDIRYSVLDLDTASVATRTFNTQEQLSWIRSARGFTPIANVPLRTWQSYLGSYVLGTNTTLKDYLGKIAPELLL
jgi:hypothetical protein